MIIINNATIQWNIINIIWTEINDLNNDVLDQIDYH